MIVIRDLSLGLKDEVTQLDHRKDFKDQTKLFETQKQKGIYNLALPATILSNSPSPSGSYVLDPTLK